MRLRLLSSLLIALAMFFAPVAIASGSGMAMAPSADHHADRMESGHCGKEEAPAKPQKSDKQSCCAAMCTAVAVAPVGGIEHVATASSADRPSPATSGLSFLVELPTPPPRTA